MLASLLGIALAVGSETGLVLPQPSAAYDHQFSPELGSDGDGYLAVWFDYRDGDEHVYGTRLGADGVVLDPDGILIATTPRFYTEEPAVASNGDGYLVAWTDRRGGIWGTRVSATGAILDGTGFEIAAGGAATAGLPSHAKVLVCDEWAIVSSYNFLSADPGLRSAHELGLQVFDDAAVDFLWELMSRTSAA